MQSISIICVGKLKESFYNQAVKEYIKRLSPFCRLEITELQEVRLPAEPSAAEISSALKKEADSIRQKIPKGAATIAMCIEGKQLSSSDFSSLIAEYGTRGLSHICFLIGGSFGLDEALKKETSFRLSMSPMTFPHHLARVMLLEQVYRCYQIIAGTKYHK